MKIGVKLLVVLVFTLVCVGCLQKADRGETRRKLQTAEAEWKAICLEVAGSVIELEVCRINAKSRDTIRAVNGAIDRKETHLRQTVIRLNGVRRRLGLQATTVDSIITEVKRRNEGENL